jgi:hypothetical protein
MEECLPRDFLEAILGLLDRDNLCTARLVSKIFCAAASTNICSLSLRSRSKASSPHRFPRLEHVTLHHGGWEKSLAKLTPSFRDLVTKVELSKPHSWSFVVEALSQLSLFPKLRELEVGFFLDCAPKYLRRCTFLESLKLHQCTLRVARAIVTLTSLTSLNIGRVWSPERVTQVQHAPWL